MASLTKTGISDGNTLTAVMITDLYDAFIGSKSYDNIAINNSSLRVTNTGKISIGTTSTTYAVNVSGTVSASAFIGGSINVSAGEAIVKACQVAIDSNNPLLAWSEGGGQSMYESNLSLHMMTKTVLAVNTLKSNNLPFINCYVNKCYGGISASFAGISDIAFVESKSTLVGFAGQHIVKNQCKSKKRHCKCNA
jgi:acetyl-CoA carboxylase carboxyl transferase subunit beta